MTRLVVGTAGHIDHGKSSLVLALTGTDPDRLKEEKARGITIELGFAHAVVDDTEVAFVDVPGHEKFVRTMLAGVGGVDFVLLIVAADESVMPQTREHFDICRLLGIRDGCVVLTKTDAVDADTLALVTLEAAELVAGSFLEGRPMVPVSARTGAGLDDLRQVLRAAATRVQQRPAAGAVRLPIDRVFTMRGFGTVVTGTLTSGAIAVGDDLAVVPGARHAKVRGLQVHGRMAEHAVAGQRTAVNLGGLETADLSRGQTLSTPDTLSVTRRVDCDVELLPGARALKHGARVRVHHGTAEILGRVSLAGAEAVRLEPGERALARLRLESEAALTRGDRVVLRAYSPPFTIGAATVLDPAPTQPGIRAARGLARLEELRRADGRGALAAVVRDAGLRGVPVAQAVSRLGLPPAAVPDAIAALRAAGLLIVAGERLVAPGALTAAGDEVVALVTAFHGQQPMSDGLPREELRARVAAGVDPMVFETLMQGLVASRRLVDRDRVALPGFRVLVPGGEEAVARVEAVFAEAGLSPGDAASMAERAGMPPDALVAAVTYLVRQKTLVRLGDLTIHRASLETLKRDIAALKAAAGGGVARIDVAQFKERYGMTRKFAIPLLEYLDRERVTRRVGDTRVVV
jgi:selenocysteine-specific elongation factor